MTQLLRPGILMAWFVAMLSWLYAMSNLPPEIDYEILYSLCDKEVFNALEPYTGAALYSGKIDWIFALSTVGIFLFLITTIIALALYRTLYVEAPDAKKPRYNHMLMSFIVALLSIAAINITALQFANTQVTNTLGENTMRYYQRYHNCWLFEDPEFHEFDYDPFEDDLFSDDEMEPFYDDDNLLDEDNNRDDFFV